MRLLVLAAMAMAAGCKPAPSPGPPQPPTADTVYEALVDAGCLAPTADGVDAVAEEHALGGDAWLDCLYDGGTVRACAVPCSSTDATRSVRVNCITRDAVGRLRYGWCDGGAR